MPPNKFNITEFRNHFDGRTHVTDGDIKRFLAGQKVKLSPSTLRWHVHQLKLNQVLVRVKPGVYTFLNKPRFQPRLSKKIQRIYGQVTGSFSPDLPCVIWTTEWLREFMVLQPTQELVILETPRTWTNSLFEILKTEGHSAFIDPSREVLEKYVLGRGNSFIVKTLVSRSPTQPLRDGIEIATLEKILIDLICDKELFAIYQGTELENIFLHSWKRYALNLSILENYAKRRRRLADLLTFARQLPDMELSKLLSK
jgi:hypothetical protein